MRKGYKYLGIGIIGALGVTAAVDSLIKNRNAQSNHSNMEYAGIPDQLPEEDQAQIENAKMVSEGSQLGIHYYNEYKQ